MDITISIQNLVEDNKISKTFHYRFIDEHKTQYIDALKTAVSIQSVSSWPEKRQEIQRMVQWIENKLKELGAETTLADIGKQTLPNGQEIPFPNILLATLGKVS